MLTRWLKKPVEPAPAESHEEHASTTVPAVSSLPVEAQEATVVVTGHSFDPPKSSTPVAATASVVRSKVSQPVTAGVWRRTGEVVASLVGAGVSTTHSLVVMVLALVGVTLALMAGGIGAVALTWLVLDEQPNAAYRSMTSVPQHTLQDSSKNGYVLLLGFGAAARSACRCRRPRSRSATNRSPSCRRGTVRPRSSATREKSACADRK